ncbi:MAG TPA: hypothetical protein VGB64_09820 [Actinomycetota bacterium]
MSAAAREHGYANAMVRPIFSLALAAMWWAVPGASDLAARGRYGPDGSFSIGRHVIPPQVRRVDPASFRLHPRPLPFPSPMPGPISGPGGGSIGSRPYGIGYFFLDASRMQRTKLVGGK